MAAADVKALFSSKDNASKDAPKKDKLAQTKAQEKFVKEVFKQQRMEAKGHKEEEAHQLAELFRDERTFHPDSKRAQKDIRHAKKHDEKIAEGATCEHGVWKCKICFPHKVGK